MTVVDRKSLAADFARALQHYLSAGDESAASEAYELGRRAIDAGVGILDVTLMFQDAVASGLLGPQAGPERLQASLGFLFETVAPFEMSFRGYREANEQLRLLARRLEHINKDLEAFSRSVSHDLHAPIRHITGYAQLLTSEYGDALPPRAVEYIARIEERAATTGRMIEDLLRLSRIERQDLVRQPVDLNVLVAETRRELEGDAPGPIEWRIAPLPTCECDRGLMKIAFANLLGNAMKYSRRRAAPVIEVGTAETALGEAVFVRDNGAGFDEAYAGKLFRVFQRLHAVEEFEGTGIGLATVARVIRKHGGRVWAKGAVDAGATFFFTVDDPS